MAQCNTSIRKIQPQAYDVFLGMDVDKRSIVALQVDHLGVEKSVRMPYDAAKMQHYLTHKLPGKRVALVYEAGPTGFGLADESVSRRLCVYGGQSGPGPDCERATGPHEPAGCAEISVSIARREFARDPGAQHGVSAVAGVCDAPEDAYAGVGQV